MEQRTYQTLKYTAILLTALFIGWSAWDSFLKPGDAGDGEYLSANKLFEDGFYERSLKAYDNALNENPDHIHALRGYARTLMQLGRFSEAKAIFDEAIAKEPTFAGTYANRGILYDRMGEYEKAINDYETALKLDPETGDGPHWLTRFLRLQPEKPPGIAERAAYLRTELAKPESERLLRLPDIDEKQRSYQQ